MEKSEVKRPLGRPRRRWEANKTIKMNLREMGCDPGDYPIFLKIGTNGGLGLFKGGNEPPM